MHYNSTPTKFRQAIALALSFLICASGAQAGIVVRGTQGVTMTGADGIYYDNTSGVTMTGADSFGLASNGIFQTQSNGVTMTGADSGRVASVDGVSYTGSNSYAVPHADGVTMTGADGVTMTGADGVTMTGADGVTMTGADGVTMTGADSIRIDNANQIVATTTSGAVFYPATNGVTMTGADGVTMTGADGVTMTGADGFRLISAEGFDLIAATPVGDRVGLMSFDPELALELDALSDDSNVNAAIVYHRAVTDADIAQLQSLGVRGGTRFRTLPVVVVTATKEQIDNIGDLASVRTIYGNRTLQWNADESRTQTGLARMRQDADLRNFKGIGTLEGNGINVAVIDTGVDATHPDLAGRVIKNVKLADLQGANVVGFNAPTNIEALSDTDQLSGHGTFVGGIIAGNGASSGGKIAGYAPKSRLVALSAGDASLFNVLAGFDYLLTRSDLGVRVVNCSFSASTLYDENDPVNVATRMLAERGVNVVFSAGNSGPGLNTLNPYAAAPWVISVAALDARGRLADFSSRGDFGNSGFRPTLAAPGVDIASLRASGINLTATASAPNDAEHLSASEAPYYTTASGTSFSAPQVAGTIALMLEANPNLTPAHVRGILQRTATPLPPYYMHEVGAGALNTHAAVLQSAFPQRHIGLFRAVLNRGQVRFVREPAQHFSGTVMPGGACDVRLSVPTDAVLASTDIAWGPLATVNDLALASLDPSGQMVAESNHLNLPVLTGKRERTLVRLPRAGAWSARVTNTLAAAATPQSFNGVFETARVVYAPLTDTGGLDELTLDNIRQSIRMMAMWPDADGRFRPGAAVKRSELAAAMIAGARVPQYVPNRPSFLDVSDATTMDFIEGAQSLFPDTVRGGNFRPDAYATRLVAAVVLVRAAGLRQEAESKAGTYLNYTDAQNIPWALRGYVQVAVSRGLISSGQQFNPSAALTRAELARGVAMIVRMNSE